MSTRPLAIALMGPTASGKTALALDWAERLGGEIVSVDSALVYRGLAIGAAKFGAVDIDAVDIDTAAVESTEQNALANGVQLHAGLPDKSSGTYQTVLANILATPLKVLAPLLCAHVAPGGHLVLAGILQRQAEELKEAYAPYLELTVADAEDGWILMTASR